MNGFESWLLSYLLNSLWQVPLLFLVAMLAVRMLHRSGAEMEHRVWVSALVLQALLPACSTLPSGWWGSLFSWTGRAHATGDAQVSVIVGPGVGLSGLHLPGLMLTGLAIAYAAVCAYFAARFAWRFRGLHAMRREAVAIPLNSEEKRHWEQCLQRFGLDQVAIASSRRIRGPVTMGVSKRLLLVPASMMAGVPEAELRTVIAHEFAHMRRNDFLKNLIYEVLSLPVSYHPAVWLVRERVTESRELVCDEMAAQIGGRNEYARSLLRLASFLANGTPIRTPHAIGIFDANAFERRLMKLTGKQDRIQGARRAAIVLLCSVMGALTCASSLALGLRVDVGDTDNKPAAAGAPLTVPAGVMAGNVLKKVAPKYPVEAKQERIQGTIVLNAVINKEGAIEELTVASGPKELQQSSLDAVRQWTYKPYLLKGNPVEVTTTINVIYSLAK